MVIFLRLLTLMFTKESKLQSTGAVVLSEVQLFELRCNCFRSKGYCFRKYVMVSKVLNTLFINIWNVSNRVIILFTFNLLRMHNPFHDRLNHVLALIFYWSCQKLSWESFRL